MTATPPLANLQRDPPLLDRSRLQPFDLGAANLHWAAEYQGMGDELYFGSRPWSDTENVGYFWGASGLQSRRRSGEIVGEWGDLSTLLDHELLAAERALAESTPADGWH